ncbi:MAG: histidinol-phosphate transaminase [Alphaproteobacteria bacterium]|nr:histidinol-phosphate transaminase [Alphaproteobacteria bacterium]
MTAPAPRPGILDIAPYVGGESKAHGHAEPVRLASNEGALGPSPLAIAAYERNAASLHRYPDGSVGELRAAIGRRYGLDPARIVCGAGSDELIALLTRAYAGPGDEVLYSQYGFLMYAIAAKTAGATPVTAPEAGLRADVDAILGRVTDRTRIVFLANPNNPTGSYLPHAEMRRLHAGLPGHVVLAVDAAYAEYVVRNDYEPGIALVDGAQNVVMLRTFSKIHALAALRLGWAYCSPGIADVLNRVRGPFNVNAPSQAAGVAAVEDSAHMARARAQVEHCRPWFREGLLSLGLDVPDSVANFLLVRFPRQAGKDADAAHAYLTDRGILVRKMVAYGLPDALRISIGLDHEMRLVLDAVAAFMGKSPPARAPG